MAESAIDKLKIGATHESPLGGIIAAKSNSPALGVCLLEW